MAEPQITDVAGVVLAGGLSSRMGRPKALLPFAGEPLATRVLARLKPQAAAVYLNAREETPALAALGATLVLDSPRWRGAGPLAGVAAGLAQASADRFAFLATAPCDAPFLPLDLVARLLAPVRAGARAAVAVSTAGAEPTFALWPVEALAEVEAALAAARGSPRALLARLGAAEVVFEDSAAFANLNTPQEFAAAEDLLKGAAPAPSGRSHGEQP